MSNPIYGGFAPAFGQTLGTVTYAGFAMNILKLDWDGIKREQIEVTNMNVLPTTATDGFGNKMFLPSAYVDPGELNLEVLHNPLIKFPITDPTKAGPQDITIRLGPALNAQEAFDAVGFMTEYKITGPLDGTAMTATCKFKLTDSVNNVYDALGAVGVVNAS